MIAQSAVIPARLREVADLPIRSGSGNSLDAACVMQLVSYVAGEPWTDHPACACPVITSFLISWNDALPTDADRTRLLAPLIPHVVGSKSTPEVERARSLLALDWLIRVHTPAWLDLVESCRSHATALRALEPIVDLATAQAARETACSARAAAWDVARAAARAAAGAARAAARAAAWDASWDAAWAARVAARAAAWDMALAAAGDAAGDAAGAAARAAARDATRAAAGDAARAAGGVARAAARAAAGDAAGAEGTLANTTATLQASAVDLVERMLALKEAS